MSNRKLGQQRPDGYPALRVSHRKGHGKRSPRLLIKCGDCENKIEIYYDPEDSSDLEIGGVLGSVGNWREILLPLLASAAKKRNRPANAAAGKSGRRIKSGVTR
jgi:hypothetical protein